MGYLGKRLPSSFRHQTSRPMPTPPYHANDHLYPNSQHPFMLFLIYELALPNPAMAQSGSNTGTCQHAATQNEHQQRAAQQLSQSLSQHDHQGPQRERGYSTQIDHSPNRARLDEWVNSSLLYLRPYS